MPPKFPEPQFRRPNFDSDGPRVRLADGQEWTFPRVKLSHRLDAARGGLARTARVEGYLPESRAYTDALQDWLAGGGDFYAKTLALAWQLLGLNYDLPGDAAGELFAFDEPESAEEAPPLVLALMPVLQGRRPKATSATGSDSA